MKLKNKHLLGIEELSKEEIEYFLDTASSLEDISNRDIKKVPTLRGKTIVTLFLEPSTRTKTSFELAAKRLSADTMSIGKDASSFKKGESLKDTAKTLQAYHVDAIVIRHSASGSANFLSQQIDASVINAGDGCHEHPTQALLDAFTIKKKFGKLDGLKVAIIGDILHSRVARSNIFCLTKMGARVTVVAPPTLLPVDIEKLPVDIAYRLDEVLEHSDVIYLLRVQKERQSENLFPSIREYSRVFGLDDERIKKIKPDAMVMHPGPINRGIEISSKAADFDQSYIEEQVLSGIAVRMAVMYALVGVADG
ncbi:hypothetical protein LCGC14_1467350 [marine sediment metagenome]|uniref:aspartate carbamoyltransferase n=1 Tax=marine sediment metagenome TaxID=412755 RepID=A0A0F9JDG5_9ZZZZ|nr:aspartate carbamoyltransferase catalytic subunit [Actinomycetota bacterium]